MNIITFCALLGVIGVPSLYKLYQIFSYNPKREIEKMLRKEQKRLAKLGKSILQFKWIVEERKDQYNGIIIDKETGQQLPITLSVSKNRPKMAKFLVACYFGLGIFLYLLLTFQGNG